MQIHSKKKKMSKYINNNLEISPEKEDSDEK